MAVQDQALRTNANKVKKTNRKVMWDEKLNVQEQGRNSHALNKWMQQAGTTEV